MRDRWILPWLVEWAERTCESRFRLLIPGSISKTRDGKSRECKHEFGEYGRRGVRHRLQIG